MSKKDETRFYFEVIDLPDTMHHKGDIISGVARESYKEDEFCLYIWYKKEPKNVCKLFSGQQVLLLIEMGKIKYLPDYKEMITI